jgi:multicomponent Na+:H+ antiporter subunit G
MSWLGDLFILIGALFMFLGALGLFRMPDVFTRLQAGTKAATLGTAAMLIGVGFYEPTWLSKLVLIGLFILLTSPVGSSSIARAARLIGIKPWTTPSPATQQKEQTIEGQQP